MPRIEFEDQPDDARLWVFAAREALGEPERTRLLDAVDSFLEGWAAHGRLLRAARALRDDRFLLIAVDRSSEPPSGCSIDALVRRLRALEAEVGTEMVSHGPVYLRRPDGSVAALSRADFRREAEVGRVTPETPVFDTTLTELGPLRAGRFELPASASWHGTLLSG